MGDEQRDVAIEIIAPVTGARPLAAHGAFNLTDNKTRRRRRLANDGLGRQAMQAHQGAPSVVTGKARLQGGLTCAAGRRAETLQRHPLGAIFNGVTR